MVDLWVPVVASAVGAAASLIGVWVTQLIQGKRDRTADERNLRDRKAARIREAYVRLLHAARAMGWAAGELKVVWEGETVNTRNARIQAVLRKTQDGMDDAASRLMLEREADDVLKAAEEVGRAFHEFRLGIWANQQQPGSVKLADAEKRLSDALERLLSGAQAHLQRLEQAL